MLRLGRERDSLNVVFDQLGTPTYARDLARTILEIFPNVKNSTPAIYHYTNEGVTSWYDFSKKIFELSKISCVVTPIPSSAYLTPAIRPQYGVLDKAKIKNEFGVGIADWEDSLLECLRCIL
jgi:dTDP-4-dehydrorhamnose reductase